MLPISFTLLKKAFSSILNFLNLNTNLIRLLIFLINLSLLNLSRIELTTIQMYSTSRISIYLGPVRDEIYKLLINSSNFEFDLTCYRQNLIQQRNISVSKYYHKHQLSKEEKQYFDILLGLHKCIQSIRRVYNITPYQTQVDTALKMFYGKIVEMPTGEGKTVTVLMCTYIRMMCGSNKVIYVTSVNDYLTKRDYEWGLKVWKDLGLDEKVALIQDDTGFSQEKKLTVQEVHLHNKVVYITHSDLIFDYMNVGRINVIPVRPKTSELIVDEVRL